MKNEIVETNDTISWLKDEIPRIQSSLRSIQKYGQNLSNLLNKLEEVKSSRLEKSEIEKAQNSTQTSIQNEQKELDKLEMDLKLLQQSHQMEIDKANKKIESLKENLESKEAENKEISDLIRGKFELKWGTSSLWSFGSNSARAVKRRRPSGRRISLKQNECAKLELEIILF